MPKKIYFIRHAKALDRSDWNAKGKPDFTRPLKKKGIAEFLEFTEAFTPFAEIEKIYSSELTRAVETADIIKQVYDTPVETDSEINHGESPRDIIVALSRKPEQIIGYTGHEPELSMMMHILIGADFQIDVKKGAVLIVNIEGEDPVLEAMTYPELFLAE